MADYAYFPGDGVSRLNASTPVGQSETGPVLDEATRQIKSYLMDSTVGPDARLTALLASINAVTISPNSVPTGIIIPYTLVTIPSGFLPLSGQSISRTTYAALFAILGTTFGSVDGSSFSLPDCRGVVIAGMDSGQAEFAALNTLYGNHTEALSLSQVAAHAHTYNCDELWVNPYGVTSATGFHWYTGGSRTTGGATSDPPGGGGGVHNNVQPVLTLNYIIKT